MNHHVGVAVHDDVRVVGRHDDLAASFQLLECRQHRFEQESIVELVFGLVHYQGASVLGFQQKRQQHADPLSTRELVQTPVASIVHAKLQEVAIGRPQSFQLASPGSRDAFSKCGLHGLAHAHAIEGIVQESIQHPFLPAPMAGIRPETFDQLVRRRFPMFT